MPQTDPYGLIASGLPPEIAAQARGLTRRQAIAEALMAQSRTPLESNRMAGGYVVPISPFEGLAKVAQAYMGRKGADAADKDMAALGARYNDMTAQEIQSYKRTKEGTPEVYGGSQGGSDADLSGMDSTYTPATPGNPQAAVMQAMLSRNPALQKLGALDAQTMQQDRVRADQQRFQASESAENRAARLQERVLVLESAAQNAALSSEERATRARELADLRRELQESQQTFMANQNRQAAADRAANRPEPLVPVQQQDGAVIYLPRSAAVGQRVGSRTTDTNITKAVQQLGRDLEKASLPTMLQVVGQAEKLTPELETWVSGPKSGVPDMLAPPEARAARQDIAKLFNITLKDRSGAAVTNQELERLKKEFGQGLFKSPGQLLTAIQRARDVVESHYQGIAASHGKGALEAYNQNLEAIGGTPFAPRTGSPSAPSSVPTATGPGGKKLYLVNGQWQPTPP